jgi:hypothetical protein
MKRLVIISLMALFAYLQAGYFFHTNALRMSARSAARRNIRAELPGSVLEKFTFDAIAKDLHWEEADKEFWLHGELYDVVKISIENSQRIIYCINDSKEKQIVEQQLKQTSQNAGDGKRTKTHKYQFPDIDFYSSEQARFPLHVAITLQPLVVDIANGVYDADSPPPRS